MGFMKGILALCGIAVVLYATSNMLGENSLVSSPWSSKVNNLASGEATPYKVRHDVY